MKKLSLYGLFLLLFLSSCKISDYKIDLNYEFDETILYFPTPIKNNSIFIGFKLTNNNTIYNELSYELLREANSKNIHLTCIYEELNFDELFKFVLNEDENTYYIEANFPENYPREITIPENYDDKEISGVNNYGFYNYQNLVILNLSEKHTVGKYAFANTSLLKVNNLKNAASTAFSNTLLNRQPFKHDYTFLDGIIKREIKVNDKNYHLYIDLNGGKILKEELNLYVNLPILENHIFENFENESGYILKYPNEKLYYTVSLKEYYRNFVGMSYIVNSKELTIDYFDFVYLPKTDSYKLSLNKPDLKISKVILPSFYNEKPITVIGEINNKYLIEIEFGEYVKLIEGKFITQNLKRIKVNSSLEYINPDTIKDRVINSFSQFN